MRKKFAFSVATVSLLFLALVSYAFAGANYMPDVKIHTLPNGITLMIVERHDSPTVACYRYHKVGSINEWPGISGAAHLLEHMMFKGSQKIGTWNYEAEATIMEKIERLVDEIDRERAKSLSGYQKIDMEKIKSLWEKVNLLQKEQRKYIRKNEIEFIYHSHGGKHRNASTSFDRTDYYVYLPSNKLEVWAFIESERLSNPVFREFYSERNVVYEERRMGINNPEGALFEAFLSTMFTTMPYNHSIVGWASDLESMRRDEVIQFFKRYYAPNNTILVLVGDVNEQEALELVKKYFGNIPRQPNPKPVFTSEPPQRGERRTEVEFDANPQIFIGFHGPKPGDPDQYALDMLFFMLSEGLSSRFYKNLVKKDIAYSCRGSVWTLGYVNIMFIQAAPKGSYTTNQLEEAIYKEIDRFKTESVSSQELEKVKNFVEAQFINSLKDKMQLANTLAKNYAWTGDWRNFDERDKLKAVTAEDIKRVAKKYLIKSNRTVVTIVPVKKAVEE